MTNNWKKKTTSVVKKQPVQLTRWKQATWSELLTKWSVWWSWTAILSWIIREDYNATLSWLQWIAMFEKMRKSDAQVFATLLACELPIRSTKRFIDAARDENNEVTPEAEEVARFVSDALFQKMTITRDSLLLEILTMLPFGFSVFEKIRKAEGDKIILEKIASRKQSTIRRRQTSLWYAWIEQRLQFSDDVEYEKNWFVDIPAEKLLIFTFRQEGDNYEGVSILRSSYKHRRFKEELYKFDAVKHERQSVWIPIIRPWSQATDEDIALCEEIVENIRANESWWIVMPWPKEEWRNFEFANMNAWSTSDLRSSINHHNREIAKNILAQFVELWNTESWSRALSEDQSDFFLLWLTAIANNICDIFNRFLIPELVDYNFNVESYPHLKFNKLWSVDYQTLSSALSTLASSWMITADEKLETHLRDVFDLPSKMETTQSEDAKPAEVIETKIVKEPIVKAHDHDHAERWHFDEEYRNVSQMFDNRFIIQLQNETSDGDAYAELKKKGFKANEYERLASRPLTFAERKVNFLSLQRSLDSFETILDEKMNEITVEMKDDLLKQVKKAVENNDIKAVWQITAKYTWKLSSALTEVQKEMFEIGKKTAAVEMNVQVPPTRKEVRGALRVQNDNIIDAFTNDIETQAKNAVLTTVNNTAWSITAAQASSAVSAASEAVDVVVAKVANNLKTLWLIGAVNLWRATIFERYPEKVYWFQYSAILDWKTTDYCRSLDGRVVKPWSAEFFKYMPPKHYNCRSLRVEILNDETFKPEFTWIPSSIPANATIDTFKPLKWPVILKWSPVIMNLKSELKDRKDKLAELEKNWQFPNRQSAHKERIEQLETALEKAFADEMYAETRRLLEADWINFTSSQ